MLRSKPYALGWTGPAESIADVNSRLPGLIISSDEMFDILFQDLKALSDSVAALTGTTAAVAAAGVPADLDATLGMARWGSIFSVSLGTGTIAIGLTATALGTAAVGAPDSTGPWQRFTTSGTIAGVSGMASQTFTRAEWNPVLKFRVRTPAVLTGCRFWCAITDGPTIPIADINATNLIGVRYSNGVDTSWVGVNQTTVAQTVSAGIGPAVLASTEYLITITISSASVTFTINGVSLALTGTIPPSALMKLVVGVGDKTGGVRTFDWNHFYVRSN